MIRYSPALVEIVVVLFACTSLCRAQDTDEQRLLHAAKKGEVSTVLSLLDKGASSKAKDENGRTPLHLAASGGHQATVEALIQSGADINTPDNTGLRCLV